MPEELDAELFLLASRLELAALRPLEPVQDILRCFTSIPPDVLDEPLPLCSTDATLIAGVSRLVDETALPLYIALKDSSDAHHCIEMSQQVIEPQSLPVEPLNTPVTDEWERSSIVKEDAAECDPKIVEDYERDHFAEPTPVQVEGSPPPNSSELGSLDVARPAAEAEDDVLLSLESLQDPSQKVSIDKLGLFLQRSIGSRDNLRRLIERMQLVWQHLKGALPSSESGAVREVLSVFAAILREGVVEETFLISCCADCMGAIDAWSGPEENALAIICFMVELSQMSREVQKYIYEDGVLTQLQPQNTKQTLRIQLEGSSVDWFALLICLDLKTRLELNRASELSLKQITDCYGALELVFDLSTGGQTTERLSFLSRIASDVILLLPIFDPLVPLLVLKLIFRRLLLLLLVTKLKSDERLKALDACGTAASALRLLEHGQTLCKPLDVKIGGQSLRIGHYDKILFRIGQLLAGTDPTPQSISPLMDSDEPPTDCHLLESAKLGPKTDKFIALLVKAFGDPGPLVRAKAIKELGRVMLSGGDDYLLKSPHFVITVCRRLDDCSPLVRDAALEFVIRLHKHAEWPGIEQLLATKITDDSIAVRKRVIRAAADYVRTSPEDGQTLPKIVGMLVRQVPAGPESISNFAYGCLKECWVEPHLVGHDRGENTGDPSPTTISSFARYVMNVLASKGADPPSCKSFFARLQGDAACGEQVIRACSQVSEVLLEELIRATQDPKSPSVETILASLLVVSGDMAIGLQDHFRLLSRFIITDDISVVDHALSLLEACLKVHGRSMVRQSKEFHAELFRLALRGSEPILRKALSCLFCIAENDANLKSNLVSFHRKILGLLRKDGSGSEEASSSICRGMLAISLITRIGVEKGFDWTISLEDTLETLRQCESHLKEPSIRPFLCIALSELILPNPMIAFRPEVEQALREGLANVHGPNVQLSVLSAFCSSVDRENCGDSEKVTATKFDDDSEQRPDYSSMACALVQGFAEELKGVLFTESKDVFEAGALLLFKVLKRGMMHPQSTIPSLLAVWRPPWPGLEEKIGALCEDIVESYDSFILSSIPQMARLAFKIFQSTRGVAHGVLVMESGELESLLQPLYKALGTKTRRRDLVHVLLREIEASPEALDYCRFLVEAISELRLLTVDEILHLDRRLAEIIVSLEDTHTIGNDDHPVGTHRLLFKLKQHLGMCYRLESIFSDRVRPESTSSKRESPPTRLACPRIDLSEHGVTRSEESVWVGSLGRTRSDRIRRLTTLLDQTAPDIDGTRHKASPPNGTADRLKSTVKSCSRSRKRAKKKRKTSSMDKYCVSEEESDDLSE